MYTEALEAAQIAALKKVETLKTRPVASFAHSMLAGAYVGLGILLIFMLGTPFFIDKSPFLALVMGSTFGVALSLVFACFYRFRL